MLKATATVSVPLDSLSQRMPAGNFLVSAVFQLFHFLHVFLLGHTLTGSGFLLLFSIKSKEERLCFAERVPNGRTTNLVQEIFCANALYICRFRLVGKGLERETLLPFPRLRRFGTHSETGSKFLLLFSIKSKDGMLCFAVKALNGRTANVG